MTSTSLKLQAEVVKLRKQVRKLGAVIYLLVTLLHAFDIRLDRQRFPEGQAKAKPLQAIERVQKVLSLRGALRVSKGDDLRYLAERSQLRAIVDSTFKLEELADGHRRSQSGHVRGKINVLIGQA